MKKIPNDGVATEKTLNKICIGDVELVEEDHHHQGKLCGAEDERWGDMAGNSLLGFGKHIHVLSFSQVNLTSIYLKFV